MSGIHRPHHFWYCHNIAYLYPAAPSSYDDVAFRSTTLMTVLPVALKTLQRRRTAIRLTLAHRKRKEGRPHTEDSVKLKCSHRSFQRPSYKQYACWRVLQRDDDLAPPALILLYNGCLQHPILSESIQWEGNASPRARATCIMLAQYSQNAQGVLFRVG